MLAGSTEVMKRPLQSRKKAKSRINGFFEIDFNIRALRFKLIYTNKYTQQIYIQRVSEAPTYVSTGLCHHHEVQAKMHKNFSFINISKHHTH